VLDRFEDGLEEQARHKADAAARLRDYEPRLGQPFPLQAELDEKLARMVELTADLAKTASVIVQPKTEPPDQQAAD
jgi:hypothetical protein